MAHDRLMTQENPTADFATEEISALAVSEVATYEPECVYAYHRDPGYRPWLRPPGPRKPTPYEEIIAMMGRNLNYAVIASKWVLIFSVFIVLDFMLPKTPNEVEVVGYHRSPAGTYQMQLNDGSVVNVSKKAMRKLKGKLLTISRTKLFGVPYRITDKENNTSPVEVSIYGNFIFMPLDLLLTSLVGVFYRKGVELRFNLGVASFVLALLNIAFSIFTNFD